MLGRPGRPGGQAIIWPGARAWLWARPLVARFDAARRFGLQRVLWPVVFRVAGLERVADLLVDAAPEARQVAGYLQRAVGRRQQLEDQGAAGNLGAGRNAEQLLEAQGHAGVGLGRVDDGLAAAGGGQEIFRTGPLQLVQPAAIAVLQGLYQAGAVQEFTVGRQEG